MNSQGGFKEYWDIIRKYPKYQGGFIWDFVDQSCHWKNKDGVNIYGYGGDFNKYDASDNNFNDNGLISPDRVPALQSAMTHRITTASVSIEVSLKRKIPFQSAS